ncbi:unnamed protein product [Rotaria magnacalcarata]|uniref:Uncharacterized protein n=1 Tax=Rotaria magnacalcarata TaxID=392030 RepID=A0A818WUV2_9BILA|nr:unnamed protein product [Rotaria magnacalcarata]CAF3728864.1 unnamed protein product [Rotaria magnacalcarata]CAF3735420.1 unnamed protein product [Rotaria magnacalcarata]
MAFKTIWEWILSNGWSSLINKNIAIKYFNNNHSESMRILTHLEISMLTNEVIKQIFNFNIHEQLIIIDSEETLLTIPFILGILQTNNSFFICDSNWSENMLRNYIIELKPSLFIRQRQTKAKIYDKIIEPITLLSIVLFDEQIDFYKLNSECYYKDIAYVVTSSGSTGIPKLIFVSHACILPNLDQLKSIFNVTSNDCLFRSTPLTFDPSLVDIFLAIHCGASLCILSKEVRQNPILISSIFNKSHCTIAQMTPSFFRQINTHCNMVQLKTLILGGEKFPDLSNLTIQQMIRQKKRVVNIYGLTEMSCWASYYILNEDDLKSNNGIPLGKALNETSLTLKSYIDNQSQTDYFQLVLESQTRWTQIETLSSVKKFIFETDDLVYFNHQNDQMFYVGRRTLTQKRFGVMINLEYIEQIANQSNLLNACVCFTLNEDENLLILLCKFKNENQISELNSYLKSNLLYHFIPNIIIPLESSIPLNINGKIDRKQIYTLYLSIIKNSSKNTLISMWQNLVNSIPDISSNFILNGGNSLLALTFIEQIKPFYSSIDPNYLFDLILHKTFGDLIDYVNNLQQGRHHDQQEQQQQQQQKTIEYATSNLSATTVINSNSNHIWSIQRCSKIFLHNKDHLMYEYFSFPQESTSSTKQLTLHWKYSMNKCIDASPLVILVDDVRQYVIIGSHAGLINCYQIDSGQFVWSFQTNDRIEATGTISRNGQFFLVGKYFRLSFLRHLKVEINLGDYSGILYIIECSNGKLYSSYQCQGLIKTIPCIHRSVDMIYLGAHDQFIHGIHLQEISSKCIWKYKLESSCASSPQLSADNCRLYVASLGGDVFAFQSDDGKLLWKQPLDKAIFSTIAIWNEKFLLVGCVDQTLYCLDSGNGQKKWTFSTHGPIFSSPCLFNNTVYIGCHDRYLYAIDLSTEQKGILKWKCLFSSMIYGSPFVYDNGRMVIVGSTDGCLRILNTQSGEIVCETKVDGNGLFSSPVVYLNFILVGSRDDYLYCYKLLS